MIKQDKSIQEIEERKAFKDIMNYIDKAAAPAKPRRRTIKDLYLKQFHCGLFETPAQTIIRYGNWNSGHNWNFCSIDGGVRQEGANTGIVLSMDRDTFQFLLLIAETQKS